MTAAQRRTTPGRASQRPPAARPGSLPARRGRWRELLPRALRGPDAGVLLERINLLLLLGLSVLVGLLTAALGAAAVPPSGLVVPLLAGGALLRPRPFLVLGAVVAVMLGYDVASIGWTAVRGGNVGVLLAVGAIAYNLTHTRQRLGFSAVGRGESMLLQLREQLRLQGVLPQLPSGWHADVVQRSAGGSSFGGDFLVASLSRGTILEVVMVDVSGKGLDAGTRALALSGALGGLLGAVPPERFLPAANDYLLRQRWTEGFATAAHLSLDLRTGDYRLATAGHPPPVQLSGGSGRWRLSEANGPVLGLVADATFNAEHGQLRPFDALLLYTDGLVETPGEDLAVGIDRLIGHAERLIPRGLTGGAARLLEAAGRGGSDDQALALFWRE